MQADAPGYWNDSRGKNTCNSCVTCVGIHNLVTCIKRNKVSSAKYHGISF